MSSVAEKFKKLGIDHAPGQEALQQKGSSVLIGEKLEGTPVDFSHGDVDAFEPLPGVLTALSKDIKSVADRPTLSTEEREK